MPRPYDDLCALYPWLPPPACGPGWQEVVERLCERIALALPRAALRDFALRDVSESRGRLRVRAAAVGGRPGALIAAAIREAEEASETVCQHCGGPGMRRARGGWTATLCEEHESHGTWL